MRMKTRNIKIASAGVFILFVIGLAALGFGLATLFTYWIWNTLAHYFHFQTITGGIAFIIVLALALVASFFRRSSSK